MGPRVQEDSHHGSYSSNHSSKAARFVALVLFFLIFEFVDLFGLSEATRRAADQIQTAITSPFHGASGRRSADKVAVVEVTNTSMMRQAENSGTRWPVPLSTHAAWLNTIVAAKPAAVFVDVSFQERSGGQPLKELADVVEQAREKGIPMLFAAGEPGSTLPEPLHGLEAVNSWEVAVGFYTLLVPAAPGADEAGPEHADAHVVEAPTHAGHGNGYAVAPTAALALYEHLCGAGRLGAFCGAINRADFHEPMLVRWFTRPHELQNTMNLGCSESGSWLSPVRDAFTYGMLWISHVTKEHRSGTRPCRPLLTVEAHRLSEGLLGYEGTAADLLTDRVVFYGMSLRGDHDLVITPSWGVLPGVDFHAQAFENLLAYGADYFSEPPMWMHSTFGPIKLELNAPEGVLAILWLGFCFWVVAEPSVSWWHRLSRAAVRRAAIELAFVLFLVDMAQRAGIPVRDTRPGFALAFAVLAAHAAQFIWPRLGPRLEVGVLTVAAAAFAWSVAAVAPHTGHLLTWFTGLLALLYVLLACSFIVGEWCLARNPSPKLLVILLGSAWIGVLNELWWRWPGTDWIALVLLYLVFGHAKGAHGPGFTDKVAKMLDWPVQQACKLVGPSMAPDLSGTDRPDKRVPQPQPNSF